MALSAVEKFERVIVLRSARILPLFLSAVATVLLVVALAALLYSIIPALQPSQPKPVPEPPQVAVNASDIARYLNRSAQAAETGQGTASSQAQENPKAPLVSAGAQAIAKELEAVRKQSISLDLPWTNEYKTVCEEIIYSTCIGQKSVLSAIGTYGFIEQAFSHHDDSSTPLETVNTGEWRYRINPSNYEAKIAIVRELEEALRMATPTNAHRMLTAWGELRESKETERERAFQSDKDQQAELYAKAQAEYEASVEKKHVMRGVSLSGIGFALAGFVSFGLVLAVLAIERHTRLLEAHLLQTKSEAPQNLFQ